MNLDPNRLWIDGCFDFTHHGHCGAILQARRIIPAGTEPSALICGVHNDRDILLNKGGQPVMQEQERYEHTRSNRWCSEVIEDAPYVTQPAVLDAHHCKYVVHGDDISTDANGEDCYQVMKDTGRFLVVKRTEGVSTTELIHRILTGSEICGCSKEAVEAIIKDEKLSLYATGPDGHARWCYVFHQNLDQPIVSGGYAFNPARAVYIEGDFDLFHVGHIEQLRALRETSDAGAGARACQEGSKLVVGITSKNPCYMTLTERVLSVLSCRYVDAVVIDPKTAELPLNRHELDDTALRTGRFAYLDRNVIVDRIQAARDHYMQRNARKGVPLEQ
ncbi:LAFE_0D02300g1_1 [Lachancea fermentati]|uniref:ethanolamine-phosphate cytidylyltransferase n=1 Tax=Lachancea fermentati TaxID=4955 RepID=A0A1G4MB04_LACFM|nr:LAFE_0D02300g1_1 [Lachancea fermentati]